MSYHDLSILNVVMFNSYATNSQRAKWYKEIALPTIFKLGFPAGRRALAVH